MELSVIMSTYNECEKYIKESIESILHQTYTDFEFLIVIDNPENETLISQVETYAVIDSRIRVIKNPQNSGLVKSLNVALREVKGAYVARMDADDISKEDRLEKEMLYMKKHALDIVGSNITEIDDQGNIAAVSHKFAHSNDTIKKILKYKDCIAHPTWLVKKSVYDELEGYRDIPSAEDYDFLLRALQKGYQFGVVPDVLLLYRVYAHSISHANALPQRLASFYLQKNLNRISSITREEIENAVGVNKKESLKYEKAIDHRQKAIEYKNGKRYFGMCFELISSLFSSKYMFTYYKNTCMCYILGRK